MRCGASRNTVVTGNFSRVLGFNPSVFLCEVSDPIPKSQLIMESVSEFQLNFTLIFRDNHGPWQCTLDSDS